MHSGKQVVLRPCPFCGKAPILRKSFKDPDNGWHLIICQDSFHNANVSSDSKEKTIDKWNAK